MIEKKTVIESRRVIEFRRVIDRKRVIVLGDSTRSTLCLPPTPLPAHTGIPPPPSLTPSELEAYNDAAIEAVEAGQWSDVEDLEMDGLE